MARASNGGWDFVKVGEIYQYKEDWIIAMIKILENNSDDECYSFKVQVQKSTEKDGGEFLITNVKGTGYYSGMIQIYQGEQYSCEYIYDIENN